MKIGPKKKLRLDDVLDYLNSPEARPEVEALRAKLEAHGAELDGVAHPLLEGMPKDLFEAKVTEFLYGSFLLPSQIQAAIPQAMTWALAHLADKDGQVSATAVQDVFRGTGAEIFAKVSAKVDPDQDFPTSRRKLKYRWLPDGVIDRVAKSAHEDALTKRMPVLAEVTRALGGKNKLKGFRSIAVQHLFPSARSLYNALADSGLEKDKTTVIGKPYSTDQDAFRRMGAEGWNVSWLSEVSLDVGGGKTFNDPAARLAEMFKDVDPQTSTERFLILDEGGKTLKTLHEHYPEYAHLCVGVEHTDRGIQLLEGLEIKCPIINVAQSVAKKEAESPMIGESIAASIDTYLDALQISVEPKEACVIGYGAVGSNTAKSLARRGYKVFVYDIDPEKMKAAAADGMSAGPRDEMLAHGHLLIGATGRGCFSLDELDKLPKNAVLANAASGRHELGVEAAFGTDAGFLTKDPEEEVTKEGLRTTMVRGRRVITGDIAASDERFHRVLRGQDGAERIALANGFVVNMEEDIPPEFIQLTRALILAGCLQAADSTELDAGFIDLSQSAQDFIVNRVSKNLKKQGLSLLAPDFRGVM